MPFQVSIAIRNCISVSRLVLLSNRGRWPSFKKVAEWAAQALALLGGY